MLNKVYVNMNKLASAAAFIIVALGLFPISVKAQLIPDRSLGNQNSQVINSVNINGLNSDLIVDGARRGNNLFHSFQEFNVDRDRGVYFANPIGVQNILTRVTGGNPSNILGTLGVEGNANLFLINPNGILFGPGARIDLNGAFIGSTASGIELGNAGSFSAIAPGSRNLLNVNPSALFFNALAQNQITVQGNLATQPGQTIGLLGGNILIDGGRIEVESGQIFLAGVNSGRVNLDINTNVIDYERVNSFGDIQITREARVRADTRDINGKGIAIAANNLLINGGAQVSADTRGVGNGGDINIDAINIEISGFKKFVQPNGDEDIERTQITADVRRGATGNSGNINIDTDNLRVLNAARIRANTSGSGNGGNINIRAKNLVEASGFVLKLADGNIDRESSRIEVNVNRSATGNGGTININSDRLIVADRADIRSRNRVEGKNIPANTPIPRSGKIIINTNTVRVLNGADIDVRTEGDVDARNPNRTTRDPNNPQDYSIFIKANKLVEITGVGADIRATVRQGASGNGGNIAIDTDTLRISNRGDIQLDTRGAGDGGNLDIFARTIELQSGGGIEADAGNLGSTGATGLGGDITINTDTLRIFARGEIAIETFAVGNAGQLEITANSILISGEGSQITSNVRDTATGEGQAAHITINSNFLRLNNGTISAQTQASRDGGDITLNINNLLSLRNGSTIGTNAIGQTEGNGGDIKINSPFIFAFPRNNEILADSVFGNGGRISISTQAIFGFPQFLTINADSGVGIDGEVNINTPDTSRGSFLRQLQSLPIDAAAIVASDICRLEDGKIARGSSFIVTGKGGLPPQPSNLINSYGDLLDWVELPQDKRTLEKEKLKPVVIKHNSERKAEKVPFIAAKGWIKRADGKIVLTADPIPGFSQNSNLVHRSCLQ